MSAFDENLLAGKNVRPASFVGLGFIPALYPTTAAPRYWDLLQIQDMCRANPLNALFHVETTFTATAGNVLRFRIFVSNDPTFADLATNPELFIAASHDLGSAGLLAGTMVNVAMPPMSDLTRLLGEGRRYIALGHEANVPTTDWVAGGVTAYWTDKPVPSKPMAYAAGY